jgi:hypothetical protein
MLTFPAERNSWTLILNESHALLRLERQYTDSDIRNLDRTTHFADWGPALRVEYAGDVVRNAPLTLQLTRNFGPHDLFSSTVRGQRVVAATPKDEKKPGIDLGVPGSPSEGRQPSVASRVTIPDALRLECEPKTIDVHPALATLVEGWPAETYMEPPSWAPPRTQRIRSTACSLVEPKGSLPLLLPFSNGLYFASGKEQGSEETTGVEWAFVNNDEVIQAGGFRWIPAAWVK